MGRTEPLTIGSGFDIGNVHCDNPLVLAPMAGVCDAPFRLICKEMGCALVYTEMISSMALIYDNSRTVSMLRISDAERPVSIQIFGGDPDVCARAAKLVWKAGANIIDINMGCPVHKVVKNREGSALMKDPKRARAMISAVKEGVDLPVTVKIRKGWDEASSDTAEFAAMCEEAGADAIAVHGRTREQGYSGEADWSAIRRVVEAVSVPVIGNGDVREPEDAEAMIRETGCAGVMIGRGAQGNPWIFRRSLHYLRTGEILPEPGAEERIAMAVRHLDDAAVFKGDHTATSEMRKHLAWYIRGLRGASRVRDLINTAPDTESMKTVLWKYLDELIAC